MEGPFARRRPANDGIAPTDQFHRLHPHGLPRFGVSRSTATHLTADELTMDQAALLEDLDQRQNAVLEQLAELNASIEALLKECLAARDQASQSAAIPFDRGALTSRSRAADAIPPTR